MNNTLKFNETSLYYIAPGFDWEPMMRFSNLATTFYYANLGYSKQQVLRRLQSDLAGSPFLRITSIKEHDDFREEDYFNMHPAYRSHMQSALGTLTLTEQQDYAKAFLPFVDEKQWLLEVQLERVGLNRTITLYYFTGEGLASYVALSHNGQFPPKVLCTVETKVLEYANTLMQRFLRPTQNLPLMWVRGKEEAYYYDRTQSIGQDKLFSQKGMGFYFPWQVRGSYEHRIEQDILTNRVCVGNITDDALQQMQGSTYKTYANGNSIMQGLIQDILPGVIIKKTLAMVPRGLEQFLPQDQELLSISFWDDLYPAYTKISMVQSLNFIREALNHRDFEEVYFLPYGFEDEGILVDALLQETHSAKLCAIVKDPMDLYELRELNNKVVA